MTAAEKIVTKLGRVKTRALSHVAVSWHFSVRGFCRSSFVPHQNSPVFAISNACGEDGFDLRGRPNQRNDNPDKKKLESSKLKLDKKA
jgi:hypothetical protein